MSSIDLIVLFGTLGFIVLYGAWKTRGSKNIKGYLLGDNSMKWGTIGLSVMATQASAITFLSTPGQAYEDGLRFVQNYLSQLRAELNEIDASGGNQLKTIKDKLKRLELAVETIRAGLQ